MKRIVLLCCIGLSFNAGDAIGSDYNQGQNLAVGKAAQAVFKNRYGGAWMSLGYDRLRIAVVNIQPSDLAKAEKLFHALGINHGEVFGGELFPKRVA